MYRKPRPRHASGILELDSLMDILSCLVGVMLFLVIYTVLELGTAAYEAEVPVARGLPPGSERVIVYAHGGTVRLLDARTPLEALLSGFEIVRYDEAERFVRLANERTPTDAYFRYSLIFEDRVSALGNPLGTIDLLIENRTDVVGDSIHQLDGGSRYTTSLDRLNPDDVWLAFAVDGESVSVFRKARELAISRGFATGFDPIEADLPLSHPLSEGGAEVLLTSRNSTSKPER
jgi:hypothetical protein